jgi:hypothetical protein
LLVLAFALGSLPRSQPGGSILANSYWLLYIPDFFPLLGLLALVLLTIFIVSYFRSLSDALGYGVARKMRKKKGHSTLRILVVLYAWVFVLVYLMLNCNGISCGASSNNAVRGLEKTVEAGNAGTPSFPLLQGNVAGFINLFPWSWFFPVFIGLLFASSAVMLRTFIVAFRESKLQVRDEILANRRESLEAVQEAIKMLSDTDRADPRMRIVDCYRRLITTGSRLGARLTPELTARELERSIRKAFLLEGPAISALTVLFEEARYSLHPITEEDAVRAQGYLVQVAQEISPAQTPQLQTLNAL